MELRFFVVSGLGYGPGARAVRVSLRRASKPARPIGSLSEHRSWSAPAAAVFALAMLVHANPAAAQLINFKPKSAPDVVGFLQDSGEIYGKRDNGHTYGWNVSHVDQGFFHEFIPSLGWAFPLWSRINMLAGARWEMAVANGDYEVLVVMGGCKNGGIRQRAEVEGVLVVDATPLDGCGGYGNEVHGTKVVSVRDGKLTVASTRGASGNKIQYLSIMRRAR